MALRNLSAVCLEILQHFGCLHELEPTSRGPYCGSLIRLDWDGSFDSNILIRTLMRQGNTLRAHAGCGIVADSDPEGEADELLWKLQPLLNALT